MNVKFIQFFFYVVVNFDHSECHKTLKYFDSFPIDMPSWPMSLRIRTWKMLGHSNHKTINGNHDIFASEPVLYYVGWKSDKACTLHTHRKKWPDQQSFAFIHSPRVPRSDGARMPFVEESLRGWDESSQFITWRMVDCLCRMAVAWHCQANRQNRFLFCVVCWLCIFLCFLDNCCPKQLTLKQ